MPSLTWSARERRSVSRGWESLERTDLLAEITSSAHPSMFVGWMEMFFWEEKGFLRHRNGFLRLRKRGKEVKNRNLEIKERRRNR